MINVLIGLGVFALGVIIGVVATVCVVIGKDSFGDRRCEREYVRGYNEAMDVIRERLKKYEEGVSRGGVNNE